MYNRNFRGRLKWIISVQTFKLFYIWRIKYLQMKKSVLLLFVALSAFTLQAQTLNLKMGLNPNKVYKQTIVQTTKSAVSYGEGTEPMAQENTTTMHTVTKTGKVVNKEFPLTMEIAEDKAAGETKVFPEGTKIYGKVKEDRTPKFDSIHAPGMDAKIKNMVMSMMQSSLEQMVLPEKTLKTGESFTMNTPLSMPMGPMTLTMNITSVYKLKKLEGRKAYLDVSQVYTMDTKVEGQDLKGSGNGTGDMVYDMDNNYPLQYNSLTNMQIAMDAGGMSVSIKNTNDSKTTTVIEANR
jgi:hypothetical protein